LYSEIPKPENEADQPFAYYPHFKYDPSDRNIIVSALPAGRFYL
jgi:hypothetical protein